MHICVLYDENMEKQKTNQTELKLMTCQEVADLLKVRLGTIYSWISYKQIPASLYRKLGKKPVFIYDEVITWFLAGAELKKRHRKGEM